MGRYYQGDIEGKFWFAVQSSADPEFFSPSHIDELSEEDCGMILWEFEKEDLPNIKKGIRECNSKLGSWGKKLDTFFASRDSYNDEMLTKALGTSEKKVRSLLKWYARRGLGCQILRCVEELGHCYFEGEC
jgi:hypothetical protein